MIWSTFITAGHVEMHCLFYSECTFVFDHILSISYNCKTSIGA